VTDHDRIADLAGQALGLARDDRCARSLVGPLERLHAATDCLVDRRVARVRLEVRDVLADVRRAPTCPAAAMRDRLRRVRELAAA
jgi:hypothetical protein